MLVYRSLNSVSSATSGVYSTHHLPQQLHPTGLQFPDIFKIYLPGLCSIYEAGSHICTHQLIVVFTFWSVSIISLNFPSAFDTRGSVKLASSLLLNVWPRCVNSDTLSTTFSPIENKGIFTGKCSWRADGHYCALPNFAYTN